MRSRTRAIRALLAIFAVSCLLFRYFLDQWLFHHRPHFPDAESGQVWRMAFHGSSYFLSQTEYIAMMFILPGIAFASVVAVMLVGSERR